MEVLLSRHVKLEGAKKLGEGTYGEAFKAEGIVFKIVPIEGSCLVNGFAQTQAFQVLAEASISLALSGLRQQGRPTPPPPPSASRAIHRGSDAV